MRPKVTVVMAVYNGRRYVQEAIQSILDQTFSDLEFLIVDDGSTDGSADIVALYRDPRMRLIRTSRNCGLATALNTGFAQARGRYLVRMDADDISKPDRVSKQVDFMDRHPAVGISGTWVEVVGIGRHEVLRHPVDAEVIHSRLLFESVLAHPSVIINRSLWDRAQLSYDPAFPCAQDFDLWVRAAQVFPLANQPDILLVHRLHSDQVGKRLAESQLAWADTVRHRQVQKLGLSQEHHEITTHRALSTWDWPCTTQFAEQAEMWLSRLRQANRESRQYPEPAFSRVLGERWLAVCQSIEADPRRLFWSSSLSAAVDMGWRDNLKGHLWRGLACMSRTYRRCA